MKAIILASVLLVGCVTKSDPPVHVFIGKVTNVELRNTGWYVITMHHGTELTTKDVATAGRLRFAHESGETVRVVTKGDYFVIVGLEE